MRKMNTTAQPAQAREPGRFDPSTWAGQARMLARNEADAAALISAIILAAVLALATLVMRHGAGLRWSQVLGPELLTGLAAGIVALAVIWAATYARALQRDTQAVRTATWRLEEELGEDLDGDNQVGRPVGHVVRIGGRKPAEVVLPDLDPPRELAPLVEFPPQPPVTANDVIYILGRATKEGLTFRSWDKHRLPSGAEIDRALWVGIQDGLLAWMFAVASTDARGRRRVELRGDIEVDVMVHAVRTGVGAAGEVA